MLAPLLLAAALAPSQYTVSMPDPPSHFFHVEVRYGDVTGPLPFGFAAFTPGGWKIDEIAGNVLDLTAADGAGHPLAATKTDKETWSIAKPGLQSRDLLVAMNDRRLSGENLSKEAGRLTPGTAVTVTFFRDGVLERAELVPDPPVPPKLTVRPKKDASAAEKAFLEAWLAPRAAGAKP